MDAIQWVASILVGAVILLLSISIFIGLAFQRSEDTRQLADGSKPGWIKRLAPSLRLIPIPPSLVRRWGNDVIEADLLHAGVSWDGGTYAAFRWAWLWLLAGAGVAQGFLRGWDLLSLFLMLFITLMGFVGPSFWLNWRIEQRILAIDLALPNFLDRLMLSLDAGLGFEIALRRTTRNFPGNLGIELRRLVRALDRGHPRSEALEQLLERNPSVDLGAFVSAVKQSDRLGTSLTRTLSTQTQIMRAHRRRRAEEAGRRLPILIVFPLVMFFLPALLIVYLAPPLLHLFLGR